MRLTCPACAVTYDVPDARIGAGRRVRCARCQHDWFVEPPSLAATPPESPRPVEDTPFARAVERAAAAPSAPAVPGLHPAARGADAGAGGDPDGVVPGPAEGNGHPPGHRVEPASFGTADGGPGAGRGKGDARAAGGGPSALGVVIAPPLPSAGTGPRLALPAPASPPTDRSGRLMAAWVGSTLFFLCFAAAVVLYRVELMEAWPPVERFYAAIGLLPR